MPINNSTSKIIFIENEDISRDSSGGVMSYILNLSSYFLEKKLKTILVGSGKAKPKINIDKKFSKYYSISDKPAVNNFKFLIHLFFTKKLKTIDKNDIIHVQRAEMVIPIALRKQNKIVCTLHGGQDLAVLKKKGKLMAFFYSILQYISFVLVDELIVVDKKNLERYLNKYPWIKDKIHLIPISVNISKFYPKDKIKSKSQFNLFNDKNILLFIGRLEHEKNVKFILDCFKKLEGNSYKLIIAGTGSLEKELKESISDSNYDVVFLGEINNTIIPELINSADALLLASHFEGSPTVVKEALCCNVPVVSTDVGDVKDVLEKVNGGKIIDTNYESFKSAVNSVITENNIDLELVSKLFSHKSMGEKTLVVYG